MRHSSRAVQVVRAVLLAASLGAVAAAPAAARTPVDPTTLNPAPPDFFNAQCNRTGQHILCTLAFSDPDVIDEPSGVVCGGTELLDSYSRSVVGKRTYDAGGDLLQRHFIETFQGVFTNPDTGKQALWTQGDTIVHDLSTAGDLDSGTVHIAGNFSRVWRPGGGTVVTDTGMFLVDNATGESLRQSANHPFDAYFTGADPSALDALCAALA
jgi:hypothetical protein